MKASIRTAAVVVAILLAMSGCVADGDQSSKEPGIPTYLDREQRKEVVSMVQYLLPEDQRDSPVGNIRAAQTPKGEISVCGAAFTPDGPREFFGRLTRTFYVWTLAKDDRTRRQAQSLCRKEGL